jgi:hypothetical protein
LTSSVTAPGSGSGTVSSTTVPSTHRAGPGADADAADAADQGAGVPVGEPADLLDGAEDAGRGVRAVDAGNEQHLRLVAGGPGGSLGGLDRGPHLGVGQVERHDHAGQHDLVVERQDGQCER